jgi:hypothetical protein
VNQFDALFFGGFIGTRGTSHGVILKSSLLLRTTDMHA